MSRDIPPGSDEPSMDEILASIRARLSEEEDAEPARPLDLTESMLVAQPPPAPDPVQAMPPPVPATANLLSPVAAAAAAAALGQLAKTVAADRAAPVLRGEGASIEDVVREELRPLLRAWLDQHLPSIVQRLVQAEIERLMGRPTRSQPGGN